MKTSLRSFTNALLLVGGGFALYYVGPVIHEIVVGPAETPRLEAAPILADSPRETAGNAYLYQSLVELQRRRSFAVDAAQSGVIEGRQVKSTGRYLQTGSGAARQFSLRLEGRVADDAVRLWQVSNSRFLWTDLKWGAASEEGLRQVWRIDLRRIKKSLGDPQQSIAAGQAAASLRAPGQWAGLGGLPMLLESLETNFDFALPRKMTLRKQPVYAMVGFWKPNRRDRLLHQADAKQQPDAPPLPSRMPHHVLVVIGARDLFPYRVEYRGAQDPLSAASVPPDRRYGESARPLLKLDFERPRFDVAIAEEQYDYQPPDGVDWMDRTSERLEMVQTRQALALAERRALKR